MSSEDFSESQTIQDIQRRIAHVVRQTRIVAAEWLGQQRRLCSKCGHRSCEWPKVSCHRWAHGRQNISLVVCLKQSIHGIHEIVCIVCKCPQLRKRWLQKSFSHCCAIESRPSSCPAQKGAGSGHGVAGDRFQLFLTDIDSQEEWQCYWDEDLEMKYLFQEELSYMID